MSAVLTTTDRHGDQVTVYACAVCLSLVPDYVAHWEREDVLAAQVRFHEAEWGSPSQSDDPGALVSNLQELVELLHPYLGDPAESRVVCEIGGGRGALTKALKAHGYPVLGVEPSEGLVAMARSTYGLEADEYVVGTAITAFETLRAREAVPRAFMFWHVLEHLEEPLEVLQEANRSLSSGGRILLQVPYLHQGQLKPEHRFFLSPPSLDRLARAAGFEVEASWDDLQRVFLTASLRKATECLWDGWPGADVEATGAEVLALHGNIFSTLERSMTQRDETILGQGRMLEERFEAMRSMEALIQERDGEIARLRCQLNRLPARILRRARLLDG